MLSEKHKNVVMKRACCLDDVRLLTSMNTAVLVMDGHVKVSKLAWLVTHVLP